MRALVTGGAGLIGSHIVDLLLARGDEVHILDSLDSQTHPEGKPDWIPEEARFIHGDVRDEAALREALDGVDVVFHQAAFGGFTPEISLYMDSNVTGTARLFEVIERNSLPVRKVVVASSQAIFGEGLYRCAEHGEIHPAFRSMEQLQAKRWEQECPHCGKDLTPAGVAENHPKKATTPYGMSKWFQEHTTLSLGERMKIPVVCLRYAVTFGPRQSLFNPYTGVVSIFSTRMLNGMSPVVYEDGLQSRDFIFVKDVARANVHLMDHPEADNQVFNVGTGRSVSVNEMVKVLAEQYELDLGADLRGEFRPQDVRHFLHDSAKLRALGWEPNYTFEQGVAEFVAWIRSQGHVGEYFSKAESVMKAARVVLTTA